MLLDPSINAERREMLDRLNELETLRGFQEIDMTPTSVVTSLPTPLEEHVSFSDIQVTSDTPSPMRSALGLDGLECIIEPPPAPLIKDLDSFTEGTAIGSFDSIPAGPTNELGDSIAPLNHLSLSLLPPLDPWTSIEVWRAVVFSCEQPEATLPSSSSTFKRPRSLAQDEDDERMKPRVRIASPASDRPSSISICSSTASLHDLPIRPRSAPPG